MKGLKLPETAEHVLILEEGDRFIQLEDEQTAVVIEEDPKIEKGLKISVFYPEENKEKMPFSVLVSLCIQEFLDDDQWVATARERVDAKLKAAAEKQKEANKEA